jgi:MraZ protein
MVASKEAAQIKPMSFRGHFDHTLDNKGRVSIPAGFRMEIQRLGGDSAPILTRGKDHLLLYPAETWADIETKLSSKSSLNPDVQNLQRFMIGGCTESPVDGQGRLTIPAHLRDFADLAGKITLSGVLDKIEIWNHDRFESAQMLTLGRLDQIQVAVDQSSDGS